MLSRMNTEKSWKPIIIKGWGGTVPRPYISIGIDGVGAVISGVTFGIKGS